MLKPYLGLRKKLAQEQQGKQHLPKRGGLGSNDAQCGLRLHQSTSSSISTLKGIFLQVASGGDHPPFPEVRLAVSHQENGLHIDFLHRDLARVVRQVHSFSRMAERTSATGVSGKRCSRRIAWALPRRAGRVLLRGL